MPLGVSISTGCVPISLAGGISINLLAATDTASRTTHHVANAANRPNHYPKTAGEDSNQEMQNVVGSRTTMPRQLLARLAKLLRIYFGCHKRVVWPNEKS
jgi:hypothetical protein